MNSPNPVPRPLDHLALLGEPNACALTTRDGPVSYGELESRIGALAAALLRAGLAAGDRVASWLPKTLEACLMPLAAARAGLVHVPINPALKKAQVEHILADSGAALLVTQASRATLIDAGACRVMDDLAARAASMGEGLPPSDGDTGDLAAILYTSGSTGKPKGVMLSHANLWLGAASVAHYLSLTPADRVLAVLPLSFDYGQNQLLSAWHAGASVTPLDYLSARDVVKAVRESKATTLAGVPPLWIQLLDADWPKEVAASLKRLTNSGGALTAGLIARMRETFPAAQIVPMYGLTEAFRSTWLDPALVDAHPTSIGKAIPFAEILIVRPDGSLCDDDEPGELVHCGPLVAQGYWQDAERTAQRFRPAPPASTYGGMAVWSGDKARRNAQGLHWFIGRDDEMIKCSGNRISPTEIEEAAEASGVVRESVALGVPDARLGQAILLVAAGKADDAEARLVAHFRRELPAFMQPQRIEWREALPRNANGKLDRSALRQEFGA